MDTSHTAATVRSLTRVLASDFKNVGHNPPQEAPRAFVEEVICGET
jgi:hypothetical protein